MDLNNSLIIGQSAAFMLFLLSELLGRCNCKCNGVIQLAMSSFRPCGVSRLELHLGDAELPSQSPVIVTQQQ